MSVVLLNPANGAVQTVAEYQATYWIDKGWVVNNALVPEDKQALNALEGGRRKVGFIGDSITQGASGYSPNMKGGVENASSPAIWAQMLSSRGAWDLIIEAGVGGERSDQIRARLQSEIINNGCDICVLYSCSWNDIGQSVSTTQSVANVTAMINMCLANDILPILCTPTPAALDDSSARKYEAEKRRRIFVSMARSYNIPLVDLYTPILDVATGAIAAPYRQATNDVHPNPLGRKVGGQAVADVLDRICVGSGTAGVSYAGASGDVMGGDGFFLNDTNSDGISNGWTAGGASATYSRAVDPVLGMTQRVITTNTGTNAFLTRDVTLVPDHMYEIAGYLTKAGANQVQLALVNSVVRRVTVPSDAPDVNRGRFSVRYIPVDTAATVYLLCGGSAGMQEFARISIRDLTALGIS